VDFLMPFDSIDVGDELPPDAEALALWQGVQALAGQARFKELKRGRTGPPTMPPI